MAEGKWTGGDGRRCATAANKKTAEDLPPLFLIPDGPMAVNRSLKNNLRRFWEEHHEGFKKMWTELSLAGKKNLLQSCVANMPAKRTDILRRGNSVEQIALLTPESNVEDFVSDGQGSLVALYENWCSSELQDDLEHAWSMAASLLAKNKLPRQLPNDFVMMLDMDNIKAGQSFHCKERRAVEKFKEFEARGIALQKDVYDLGNERVNKILTVLALYADEYRTEMLGLDNFFVAAPLRGCAACGKTETPEGLELRGCRNCVNETIALFCSKDCQRRFFKTHMAECKRLQKVKEEGVSDSCQVCGDLKAEGGSLLKVCGRCNSEQVKYCSKECQKTAWQAGHRRACQLSES
ncbi:hypothetical protein KFL_001100300 [Klebsormidium nitens]|uniref:MYND-type domain-containing protein n=1 Tax=Klebsormidium nitens TaxID=105231 RepID=A0A1Y1I0W7_KLENI|nr:hypothetical protein KFL_001100300 [Klebsormidium nitens]|eukprot:GAQ82416.1 hypothetical protein KFL_001100300 [Klebsormidium nitens]